MGPDKQQATSYTSFNSINTQPIVPDCLTIDFVNTAWKVDVALQREPERERNVERQLASLSFFSLKQPETKSKK